MDPQFNHGSIRADCVLPEFFPWVFPSCLAQVHPGGGGDMAVLTYRGLQIEVLRKPIKHLYLRVYPPAGRVCVSMPWHTSAPSLRHFLEQKWPWIEQQRARIIQTPLLPAPQWISGEQHHCLGETYTLEVREQTGQGQGVVIEGRSLILIVPPAAGREVRQQVLETWCRQVLKAQIPPLLAHWQSQIGVEVTAWGVKKMKTRWGSCNTVARRIWLSLALVHYPLPCVEQVLVHELIHLLERGHTPRFWALMDRYLPDWRTSRAILNGRPPRQSHPSGTPSVAGEPNALLGKGFDTADDLAPGYIPLAIG